MLGAIVVHMKKLNTKPKSELKQLSEDFKRHIGAFVERMDDNFKLNNEEFKGINHKLDSHSKEIISIHQKLDSHTQMIGQIMIDVAQIKLELKQKVSIEDFARLEKRVGKLELVRYS